MMRLASSNYLTSSVIGWAGVLTKSAVLILLLASCVKKLDWKGADKESLVKELCSEASQKLLSLKTDLGECEIDLAACENALVDMESRVSVSMP